MNPTDTKSAATPLTSDQRARLDQYLRQLSRDKPQASPVPHQPVTAPMPLSYAQEQVWVHSQLAPDVPVYHEVMTVYRRGHMDMAAMIRAVNEVMRRHDAWRTTIEVVDGEPLQVIHPRMTIDIPVVDLSHLPREQREAEAARLGSREAQRLFDLSKGPLFRATLCRLAPDDYRMFMTFHHIIFDGISGYRIFWRELQQLYAAFAAGQPSPLPEVELQYPDFSAWQRQWIAGGGITGQIEYWKRQAEKEVSPLALPTDRPRPAVQSFHGGLHRVHLSRGLSQEIIALSKREGATTFMTLLTAFEILLQRYTMQDEFAVGTVNSGRNRSEFENILGCFQNPLMLRAELGGNPTFRELLRRNRAATLEALSNGDVPFEILVRELRVPHDPSRNPLFQVLFTVVPALPEEDTEWRITQLDVETGASKFDIYLELDEQPSGIGGRFMYSTDLFDAATIARMSGHLETLLTSIVEDPDARISDLPLLNDAEKRQILVEWNNTRTEYPSGQCIHELFEARVGESPDAVAVVFGRANLTYRQLDQRANQFANQLTAMGVPHGGIVGICLDRSPEMIAALLGILKAGAAYLPLDPELPADRLALLLRDGETKIVITQRSLETRLPRTVKLLRVDGDNAELSRSSRQAPHVPTRPDDLAYIMHTSGSTGMPKGVAVRHRSIVRLVFGVDYAEFGPKETFLQLAPLSFDASTLELWGPLLHGGRCVLFPGRVPAIEDLGEVLEKEHVSTLWLTSSLFNTVIDQNPRVLHNVRQLLIGGEALSLAHVQRALQILPNTRIINGYGPTEGTTFTCCYPIPPQAQGITSSVPIGRPIGNTQVYLLDPHGHPTPVGIAGELYIGGDGVAQGYFNRRELTAERFLPNPFDPDPNAKMYRTGDLARYRPDGNIEFCGRTDDQVKIRGHRIEPGEVEAALKQLLPVKNAAVIVREESPGEKRLVAYWVPSAGAREEAGDLRTALRRTLPEYMVPAAFVKLENIPLTANGKVDKRRLPAPNEYEQTAVHGFRRPKDESESRLLRIWEEVLGRHRVSVDDDFFDLGGHSLLAVRLMHRIEREFGRRLPLSTLFLAPTVERMAALLKKEGPAYSWECLVPIEPRGTRPPFFCIHGIGGTLLRFRELARRLGGDQPVYGLEARGLDGKQQPLDTVEEMAALYIREIRSLQPEGPYYLSGLSFGGVVAFEMAQQLIAAGQKVGLLALFDTYPGKVIPRGELLRKFIDLPMDQKMQYLVRKTPGFAGYMGRLPYRLTLPRPLKEVKNACRRASVRYEPKPYPGCVTLFRASERALRGVDDPQAGWSEWAGGGVEVHTVAGTHVSIVADPHVRLLAEELRGCLERAQAIDPTWLKISGAEAAVRAGAQSQTLVADLARKEHVSVSTSAATQEDEHAPRLGGPSADKSMAYWRALFGDLPGRLELPTDRPRHDGVGARPSAFQWSVSREVVERVAALCGAKGIAPAKAWLAAFATLLFRYTGQSDMPLACVMPAGSSGNGASRGTSDILALRLSLDGKVTFENLAQRLAAEINETRLHAHLPVQQWLSELFPGRNFQREPLFSVGFAFDADGLPASNGHASSRIAGTELELQIRPAPAGGMAATIVYDSRLWSQPSMERLAGHYSTLLAAFTSNPEGAIARLALVGDAERTDLARWNDTAVKIPEGLCVQNLIEAQAARTPDALALLYGAKRLSYRDLNERANQLAHFLMRRGVGPDSPVAVCLEGSPDLIVALLAIMKAGGACVPLDPKYPDSRLAHMLQDSGARLLLTRKETSAGLPDTGAEVICMTAAFWEGVEKESRANPSTTVNPANIVYIIYTSGSTGRPKGVLLTHRGYVNHHLAAVKIYGLTAKDRVPQLSSISFDISVEEIFPTLASGGAVVLRTEDLSLDLKSLVEWSNQLGVTVWNLPTALWHELVNELAETRPKLPDSLRLVIVGGEKALARAYGEWRRCAGEKIQWLNTYGPTEASIVASSYDPSGMEDTAAELPIGRPLQNYRLYVLDENLQCAPVGVFGELYIGGIGVARGYLNAPEVTAERFIADSFASDPGARMYRTGDLARWLPDGNVEFRGRSDDQVKIQGFRVEPGEVEAALVQHPGLRSAAVVAREVASGDNRLVAYYVPTETSGLSPVNLRDFLKERLPEYMLPAGFVRLEAMPLTPNGKVDRRGLPAVEWAEVVAEEGYVAPRTEMEMRLAHIWESVFAAKPIGVKQSFFDLGGYSLLAVRLMHRIEKELGRRLPIAALLQAPTIETLARILQQGDSSAGWSSLVPIQPRGTKTPLFCVHGIGGAVMTYRELGQCLPPGQPLYALQAQGLDGKRPVLRRVEEMAAHYIREIRTVQPSGPYALGGLSFGGMVALEMAHQLKQQGEKVSLLVLLDTFPGREQTRTELLAKLARMPRRERAQYVARRLYRIWTSFGRRLYRFFMPAAIKAVQQGCQEASHIYVPPVYDGKMTLFRPTERSLRSVDDETAGWGAWARGGVQIIDISGGHISMMRQPNVRILAQHLKECLARAFPNGKE